MDDETRSGQDTAEGSTEALFKYTGEATEDTTGTTPPGPASDSQHPVSGYVPPTEAPAPYPAPKTKARRRPPSLFGPLLLIGAGIALLLSNLGYVPWSAWNVLWRLWPLLLIVLGVDILIGRRSAVGAIFSALFLLLLIGGVVALLFFAQDIPAWINTWTDLPQVSEWQVKHVEYPLAGVERSTVRIDWGSSPGTLRALKDSNNLIVGDVAYSGELVFEVKERGGEAEVELDQRSAGPWRGPIQLLPRGEDRWDIRLSPRIPLNLDLDSGSGRCSFDLSELDVEALVLDVGSGTIELVLPARTFEARIDGGSGGLTIVLPQKVGARVTLDAGSGGFHPAERFRMVSGERDDDSVWETRDWQNADQRIEFRIDQGSGRISIR
jgi:hypothetical protein